MINYTYMWQYTTKCL